MFRVCLFGACLQCQEDCGERLIPTSPPSPSDELGCRCLRPGEQPLRVRST